MSASASSWRISQSGSTRLSASVVAYQAGLSAPHSDLAKVNPAARAAPTLPASTVTKWISEPNRPASSSLSSSLSSSTTTTETGSGAHAAAVTTALRQPGRLAASLWAGMTTATAA